MRRREFLLLGGSAALCWSCSRSAADSRPDGMPFLDTFDDIDRRRWTTGDEHTLGRSTIVPDNVRAEGGELRLSLPGATVDGAELHTVRPLLAGTYRARIAVADAPDSVTGFFLYAPPDFEREVDMEIYNRPAGLLRLTTYSGGRMTKSTEVSLPFDPTSDFHDYVIALTDEGVEFYADGIVVGAWSEGVPTQAMNLYINAWYPRWLAGRAAADESVVRVTSVDFTPR